MPIKIKSVMPDQTGRTPVGPDKDSEGDGCVNDLKTIGVRSPVMRLDIGTKFVAEELPELIKMGYVDE